MYIQGSTFEHGKPSRTSWATGFESGRAGLCGPAFGGPALAGEPASAGSSGALYDLDPLITASHHQSETFSSFLEKHSMAI